MQDNIQKFEAMHGVIKEGEGGGMPPFSLVDRQHRHDQPSIMDA
jgi:hypothetical protein